MRSFSTLMQMAIEGNGVAFLPEFVVRSELAAGRLVRCLPRHASDPVPVFMTYRPGAQKTIRVRAVMDVARDLVPALLPPPAAAGLAGAGGKSA